MTFGKRELSMFKRLVPIGVVVLALSLLAPAPALAHSGTQTYFFAMEAPNTAQAENGDSVAVTGEGTFSVHPKSVDAAGSFTHTFAAGGSISGTWVANELLEYQSYGCGVVFGTPLPPDFCGGAVKMSVTLTVGTRQADGILTIFCLIGPNPPNSADEGVTLVVPGIINFNKVVSGDNFYQRLP